MSIENIVLSHDQRGISSLRPYLPADFCVQAAAFILDHCPGTALIATGFYVPAGCAPETDGPPGAVALGVALERLGCRVCYVTDAYSAPLLRGLVGSDDGRVIEYPISDHEESRRHARELIGRLAPTLTIAVERCGLTAEGLYRNMRRVDVSRYHAKVDYLFREHEASVGIGDGGNEIGMGNLAATIPTVMPVAEPCVTTTSRLVIASVSNWGAWGVIAAASRLRGVNLLPTVDEAHDLLVRTVALGAVDGVDGRRTLSVDGFSIEDNDRVLSEMLEWVTCSGAPAAT